MLMPDRQLCEEDDGLRECCGTRQLGPHLEGCRLSLTMQDGMRYHEQMYRHKTEDSEKGVPFRHARDKARLLADDAFEQGRAGELYRALNLLIDKRPVEVLDALIDAMAPGDEEL